MLRVLKLATPFTAGTAVVPERVPPAGLAPSATVIVPAKLGTRFPNPSCALTCTAGVIGVPTGVGVGCTVNANRIAGPGLMANGALVVVASPLVVAVKVYPVPGLST